MESDNREDIIQKDDQDPVIYTLVIYDNPTNDIINGVCVNPPKLFRSINYGTICDNITDLFKRVNSLYFIENVTIIKSQKWQATCYIKNDDTICKSTPYVFFAYGLHGMFSQVRRVVMFVNESDVSNSQKLSFYIYFGPEYRYLHNASL